MRSPKAKPGAPIAWDSNMKLPPGSRLPRNFMIRVLNYQSRVVGCGTIEDPKICWLKDETYNEYTTKEDNFLAIETIIRDQARKLGLPYVWIAKETHGTSIVARGRDGHLIMSEDDNHITVRMGIGPDTCNLHGHFYLVLEGHRLGSKAIRMMEEHERSVVGGKNPQLWVWGSYPPEYQRSVIKYPKSPFEIKPGSILDMEIERCRHHDEREPGE